MLDILTIVSGHMVVGGIAANALLIISLASVAFGGEGSRISPARKLPKDSDAQLFGLLFAIGAVCGLVVAFTSGLAVDWVWVAPTGVVSFIFGSIIAYMRVSKLNEQYLSRARDNYEQGKYKEAIEDASEVIRSSERLRSEANQIAKAASAARREQPLGDEIPLSEPANDLVSTRP